MKNFKKMSKRLAKDKATKNFKFNLISIIDKYLPKIEKYNVIKSKIKNTEVQQGKGKWKNWRRYIVNLVHKKPATKYINMDPVEDFKKENRRSMTNYERSQYFRRKYGSKRAGLKAVA